MLTTECTTNFNPPHSCSLTNIPKSVLTSSSGMKRKCPQLVWTNKDHYVLIRSFDTNHSQVTCVCGTFLLRVLLLLRVREKSCKICLVYTNSITMRKGYTILTRQLASTSLFKYYSKYFYK